MIKWIRKQLLGIDPEAIKEYNVQLSANVDALRDNVKDLEDKIKKTRKQLKIAVRNIEPEYHHGDLPDLSKVYYINAPHAEGQKPVPNSILELDGKRYRVRAETLIIDKKNKVFAAKRNKLTPLGCWYKIPGGSIEPDKSILETAIAECHEEGLVEIRNIKYSNYWYINDYDWNRVSKEKRKFWKKMNLDVDGLITLVFIAEHSGSYDKDIIPVEDQVDWSDDLDFYNPNRIYLMEVHRKALATFKR